ncbi:MAG TPA: 50S ribosomal protein L35 [Candidatus Krumholzibacteria bacterium]|nr:50S ribosomal protein L35 [Candidatus Krumholzibacteria bacterium]
MPKMKTHRGLAKRVRRTASGRLKRKKAYHSHLLASKSRKQKRRLRGSSLIAPEEEKRLKALLND